jgi:hypothetical protein
MFVGIKGLQEPEFLWTRLAGAAPKAFNKSLGLSYVQTCDADYGGPKPGCIGCKLRRYLAA